MRTYTELSSDDQDQIRTQRIKQLEAEHYGNTLALLGAQATLDAADQLPALDDTDQSAVAEREAYVSQQRQAVSAFEANLQILDVTLDALTS